jgi:formylglycine-generating enzyme required for sulfatase activity/predicted Ser/Thr protein kinase
VPEKPDQASFSEQPTMRPAPRPDAVFPPVHSVGSPRAAKPAPTPSSPDAATMKPTSSASARPSSPDAVTMKPTSTPEAVTMNAPVNRDAQTGVIPGRHVDQHAGTIQEVPAAPVSPDSRTMSDSRPSHEARTMQDASGSGSGRGKPRIKVKGDPAGDTIAALGPYDLHKELGRGGMGVVYRARHTTLNRDVALKVMLGGDEATETDIRRFLREAEACAALKHPNIVPVHDIGQHEGRYYFSMEFVEGQTLLDWTKTEKRTPEQILEIMRKVCEAIAYAHQRGIIHRDLKPHNVMVDASGEPKVMDFGLAKRTGGTAVPGAEKTVVGTIMGTPQYMPPEQASGRTDEVDTRSDVYALGVMLYEMLTGDLPINADSLQELLFKIENVDPLPLRARRPELPWEVEVIVAKALAKEKEQRFQSAQELADDIGRFLRKEPIRARTSSLAYRARKFVQRNRTLSAIAATVIVLVGIGGWLAYGEIRRDAIEAEQRLAKAIAEARDAAREVEAGLGAFEKNEASLTPRDALARLKAIDAALDKAKAAIAGAELLDRGDKDVQALMLEGRRAGDMHALLTERSREKLARVEEGERRRTEAADLVKQAKAKRELVRPEAIDSPEASRQAAEVLSEARDWVVRARGLDEKHPDARAEIDAIVATEKAVADAATRIGRREELKRALANGKARLDEARGLIIQRLYAEDEQAESDAVGLTFQKAVAEFEHALRIDDKNALAIAGIVDATLEDARLVVEENWDFTTARRAAVKIERFAPERVREFRAWLRQQEAIRGNLEQLVTNARAERTRGKFQEALVLFQQAIALSPDDAQLRVQHDICDARVKCAAGQHAKELAVIEAALRVDMDKALKADVDEERGRALGDVLGQARDALTNQDTTGAAQLVDLVLARLPQSAEARALKVEIGGRRSAARGMIFVSAGPVRFSLAPEQEVEVAAFFIGESEVTNGEFHDFVKAGGYADPTLRTHWPEEARPLLDTSAFRSRDGAPGPGGWAGGKPIPGTEDLPVSGVSWSEAAAYARWRGARLPTEVEWEKAALWKRAERRPLERPWKHEDWATLWEPYFDRIEGAKPVRAAFGKGKDGAPLFDQSPCGAFDMYGNVHEWVGGPSSSLAASGTPDGRVVARGGSYLSRLPDRAAPTRRYLARPDFRAEHVGFRIAMTPSE